MTSAIYQEWLLDWDRKLKNEGQKILLLQDNSLEHVIPETLTNIHVINFKANIVHNPFSELSIYETGITPSKIYDIDQLKAMRLAKKAWEDVDMTAI